jgi:hypothetical protein
VYFKFIVSNAKAVHGILVWGILPVKVKVTLPGTVSNSQSIFRVGTGEVVIYLRPLMMGKQRANHKNSEALIAEEAAEFLPKVN